MLTHWQCTLIGQRLEAYRRHCSLRGKARSWEQVGRDLVEYDHTLNPEEPRETNAVALGESLRRFTDPGGRGSTPNDPRMAIVRDFLISEGFLDEVELSEEDADGHLFARLNSYFGLGDSHVARFAERLAGEYQCIVRPDEDHYERNTLVILFADRAPVAKVTYQRELFNDPKLRPIEKWSERDFKAHRRGRRHFSGWAIMSPDWGATLALNENYGRENASYTVLFASPRERHSNLPVDLIVRPQATRWSLVGEGIDDPDRLVSSFLVDTAVVGARVFRRAA